MFSSTSDFDVIKTIGAGGFGVAQVVCSKADKKNYVVKSINIANLVKAEKKDPHSSNESEQQTFRRIAKQARNEVQIMKSLDSKNIVKVYSSFPVDDSRITETLYISMEYCESGTMKKEIWRWQGKHFPESKVERWMAQLVTALSYLFNKKLLHRDIKTENIFLTCNGNIIKLGDFGTSKFVNSATSVAKTQIGTYTHFPPELWDPTNPSYTFQSEVWALGVVMFEIMDLDLPFTGNNMAAVGAMIMTKPAGQLPKMYSAELRELVTKELLNKDPKRRPTMLQLVCKSFILQAIAALANSDPSLPVEDSLAPSSSEPKDQVEVENEEEDLLLNVRSAMFLKSRSIPVVPESFPADKNSPMEPEAMIVGSSSSLPQASEDRSSSSSASIDAVANSSKNNDSRSAASRSLANKSNSAKSIDAEKLGQILSGISLNREPHNSAKNVKSDSSISIEGPSASSEKVNALLNACEQGDINSVERSIATMTRQELLNPKTWRSSGGNEKGDSPLHRAARRGQDEVLAVLWRHLSEMAETENQEKRAPIHVAAYCNQAKALDFFISRKKSLLELKDGQFGRTPLHIVSQLGFFGIAKYLIEKGANAYPRSNENDGQAMPVHLAVNSGNEQLVNYFLTKYPDLLNEIEQGRYLLHKAAYVGQVAIVELLLKKGMNVNLQSPSKSQTALHIAAAKGHLSVARHLIQNGANLYAKTSLDDDEDLPIHVACTTGQVQIVDLFLNEKPDLISMKDANGHQPIHRATISGQAAVVDLLLQKGVSIEEPDDKYGRRPLHQAAAKGHLALAKLLVTKGADCLAKTKLSDHEKLPIHYACLYGKVEVAEFLLDAKPETLNATDFEGDYLINLAALGGSSTVIEFLLRRGLDINQRDGTYGRTPLHQAATKGHTAVVKMLIRKGADVFIKTHASDDEELPIHLAAGYGDVTMVEALLQVNNELISQMDRHGQRPIHRAAMRGNIDIVTLFLRQGIDVDVRSGTYDRTPLHVAAATGQLEMVKFLIQRGANVFARSSRVDDEDMPIHLAAWQGRYEVVKHLISSYPELANAKDGSGRTPLKRAEKSANPASAAQVISYLKGL